MRKFLLLVSSVFVFCFSYLLVVAKTPDSGVVKGTVLLKDTKEPLEGVRVELYGSGNNLVVRTAPDGSFLFKGVRPGWMRIYIDEQGFSYFSKRINVKKDRVVEVNIELSLTEPRISVFSYEKTFIKGKIGGVNLVGVNVSTVEIAILKGRLLSDILETGAEEWKVVKKLKISSPVKYGSFYKFISVEDLSVGYYMVKAFGTGVDGTTVVAEETVKFLITDFDMICKGTSIHALVYTQKSGDTEPVAGVKITIYDLAGSEKGTGVTDSTGVADIFFYTPQVRRYLVYGCSPGGAENYVFIYPKELRDSDRFRAYIYTDRPVYRPLQKVYFKAILRILNNKYEIPEGVAVVSIETPDGKVVYEKKHRITSFGTLYGYFDLTELGEEPPIGEYVIKVSWKEFHGFGYFYVKEYRKPEFVVKVEAPSDCFIYGERIKIKSSARYYFGQPVTNAKVEYAVYARRTYFYKWWRNESDYIEESELPFYEFSYGYGDLIASGKGTTNGKGEFSFIFIPKRQDDHAYRYFVEVTVTDQSGYSVTNSTSFLVTPGKYLLFIKTDYWAYVAGQKVVVNVESYTPTGKPVAVAGDWNVEWERAYYYDKKKRKWISERVPFANGKFKTTSTGKGEFSFDTKKPGYYRIEVKSIDDAGNLIVDVYWIYCYSSEFAPPMKEAGMIEIVPVKRKYNVGETMQFIVFAKKEGYPVLVTLEGEDIYDYKIIRSRRLGAVVAFNAESRYAPNVYVSACYIHDSSYFSSSKMVVIGTEQKKLSIKISTDKQVYRPGDVVNVSIEVKDHQGRPVVAEVSVGVVDEAIYAIQPEIAMDVWKFFYLKKRRNLVSTEFSIARIYKGGMEKESVKIRKRFKDTAFWKAAFKTDSNGLLKFSFKLPDNLTTWRFTVTAVTVNSLVGRTIRKILVTKPVIARMHLPRFMVEGDRVYIPITVHNYMDKADSFKIDFRTENILIDMSPASRLFIKPFSTATTYAAVVPQSFKKATFVLKAIGKNSDALQVSIPVLPYGKKLHKMYTVNFPAVSSKKVIGFKRALDAKAEEIFLYIYPSFYSVTVNILKSLVGYPYGCVEQTMSKLYPTLIARGIYKKLGMKDAFFEQEVPKMIKKGLAKIYWYQHSDGGWGWWRDDETDPYMTAYVVDGLTIALATGVKVDTTVLERAYRCMRKLYSKMNFGFTKAYLAYSLSTLAEYINAEGISKKELKNMAKKGSLPVKLVLLRYFANRDPAFSEIILKPIKKKIKTVANMSFLSLNTYSWRFTQLEANAYLLWALSKVSPADPVCSSVASWIMRKRRYTGYWYSTKASAVAVMALLQYSGLQSGGWKSMFSSFDIILNGRKLKSFVVKGKEVFKPKIFKIKPEALNKGINVLVINKSGNIAASASLVYKGWASAPVITPEKTAHFEYIKRRYYIVNKKGEARKLRGKVKAGSIIKVVLKLKSKIDLDYLVIEDKLPAGAEVIEKVPWEREWWKPYHMTVRDEKVAFFVRFLSAKQPLKIEYYFRPELKGKFNILPAEAYCMYEEAPFVSSEAHVLVVK